MTDETEREALYTEVERNLGALDIEFEPGMEPFIVRFADAILAAGFRRTATPHVVTTVEGLRDLPHGTHLRGALGQAYLVLDGGVFAAGRATACTDEALTLPATVLTTASAPVDREALAMRVCHARRGHLTPGTYACDLCRGEVDRVLAALKAATS